MADSLTLIEGEKMNVKHMNTSDDATILLHRVKFYLLLILQVLSILLYLLVFTFLFKYHRQIKTLVNQGLILLLLVNFLVASCALPMTISFYRLDRVSPVSSAYCTFWTFVQYTLNVSSEILMAIISVQRHVFILNGNLLHIRMKRIFYHDIPLLLGVAYPTVLYFGLVVIYPCDGARWDFSTVLCGYRNCYLESSQMFATFDWALHNGMPIVIIIVANAVLLIRVIYQKRRLQQVITWKKQRRMTLQLLSVASLYFIAWVPITVIAVIQQIHASELAAEIQSKYVVDFLYLVCLLTPLVCISAFPELKKWIKKLVKLHEPPRNTVGPTRMTTNHVMK